MSYSGSAVGLVDHDTTIGEGGPLSFRASCKKQGAHRSSHSHTYSVHWALDELDSIIDGKSIRD